MCTCTYTLAHTCMHTHTHTLSTHAYTYKLTHMPDTPGAPASTPEPGEDDDQHHLLEQLSERLQDLSGGRQPKCPPLVPISTTQNTRSTFPPTRTGPSGTNGHGGAELSTESESLQYVIKRPVSFFEVKVFNICTGSFCVLLLALLGQTAC